ncbi:MAG: acetyl-CoA carboxylase biotin carboxyl carrier protein subunit [Cyclobacteriaceae bacterium]|nr:MAG: acetyl-CoA carboxylase biotin carboxyl carrier protein subunit [Cyclobacteriaceae bacterium]
MLKVTISETSYQVVLTGGEISISGEKWDWDLEPVGDRTYHLIKDSKSYLIEVLETDQLQKSIQLRVNGITYQAQVQDRYDLLLEKLGMQALDTTDHKEVIAPMPGLILDILVKEGQAVAKGDKLLVLEAMKMENIIKSAGEGVISSIDIEKGMNVEKNQVLIQF